MMHYVKYCHHLVHFSLTARSAARTSRTHDPPAAHAITRRARIGSSLWRKHDVSEAGMTGEVKSVALPLEADIHEIVFQRDKPEGRPSPAGSKS